MKRIIALLMIIIPLLAASQEVALEKVLEINKPKSELFSITKSFIADSWNNPKKVITNEDKDLGMIQASSEYEAVVKAGMGLACVYDYSYKVRFRVKDGKCKVEIYDIVCTSASQEGLGTSHSVPEIPYFQGEDAPKKTKSMGRGISSKKAVEMMAEFNAHLQSIFTSYADYLESFSDF